MTAHTAPSELDRANPPPPAALRSFDFPAVESAELPTGMRLRVAPIHRLPVVTLTVLLPFGGSSEPSDLAGITSFTAALLEGGAGDRNAEQIAEDLESIGADLDVGVSWDATHVGITALASHFEQALEILTTLIREPTFPADEFERLRRERLAEVLQRRSEPRSLASLATAHALYDPASPYSRPLIGHQHTLGGLTRQDVLAFHAEHYRPSGATLIAAGDLELSRLQELAERCFGDWAGLREPRTIPTAAPRTDAPKITIVDRPDAAQAELRVGHVGVDRATPDFFPLTVMNAILGGSFSSRLNLNLRERHGYTYGAHSGFSMRRQPGPFVISAAVQTETVAAALREILHEVDRLQVGGPTDEEMEAARNYIAGVFPLRLQSTTGVVSRLAEVAVYDLPPDYLQTYRSQILAVSAEDVTRVARDYIRPESLKTVIVGSAAAVEPLLTAEGFHSATVITTEKLG